MEKAVIQIKTLMPGEKEFLELTSLGTMECKGNKVMISYKESELTGMDDTETTIILSEEDVIIRREGDYVSRLEFCPKEPRQCLYHTPYGTFNVTTQTLDYRVVEGEKKMELFLNYGLLIEGESQGATQIEMVIRPQNQAGTIPE